MMSWIIRAEVSGIKMLKNFAKTTRKHFKKILAHYDYPISTGIIEGTNNKIKTLSKRIYGFRDAEYFKLKIMVIHKSRYVLTGLTKNKYLSGKTQNIRIIVSTSTFENADGFISRYFRLASRYP